MPEEPTPLDHRPKPVATTGRREPAGPGSPASAGDPPGGAGNASSAPPRSPPPAHRPMPAAGPPLPVSPAEGAGPLVDLPASWRSPAAGPPSPSVRERARATLASSPWAPAPAPSRPEVTGPGRAAGSRRALGPDGGVRADPVPVGSRRRSSSTKRPKRSPGRALPETRLAGAVAAEGITAASVAIMCWTSVPTWRARCSSASCTSSWKKRTLVAGRCAGPRLSWRTRCAPAPRPAVPVRFGGWPAGALQAAASGSGPASPGRATPGGPEATTWASPWATSAAPLGLVSGRRARWTTRPTVAAGRPAAARAAAVAGPVRTHIGAVPPSARARDRHAGGRATTGSSGARRICRRNREARVCPTCSCRPAAGRRRPADPPALRARATPSDRGARTVARAELAWSDPPATQLDPEGEVGRVEGEGEAGRVEGEGGAGRVDPGRCLSSGPALPCRAPGTAGPGCTDPEVPSRRSSLPAPSSRGTATRGARGSPTRRTPPQALAASRSGLSTMSIADRSRYSSPRARDPSAEGTMPEPGRLGTGALGQVPPSPRSTMLLLIAPMLPYSPPPIPRRPAAEPAPAAGRPSPRGRAPGWSALPAAPGSSARPELSAAGDPRPPSDVPGRPERCRRAGAQRSPRR